MLKELLKKADVKIENEIINNDLSETIWKLPFVYIFERNDFSVSFYAFFIYPQTIRKALLQESLESIVPEIQEENVFGGEAPERFYEINGKRVYLEIDGIPIEQYIQGLNR